MRSSAERWGVSENGAVSPNASSLVAIFKSLRLFGERFNLKEIAGGIQAVRTQTEKEADMVVNELIIEKTGERHRLTDGEAEAFRAAKPLKRFPGIRIMATYRRQDGGISVYARKGAPCR